MRAKWSMLFGPEGSIILWPKGSILFGQRGQICLAFPLTVNQECLKQERQIVYITLLFNATSSMLVSLLAKTSISSRIFSLVIRAYI